MQNEPAWLGQILRKLGITEAYKGYHYIKEAVTLASEDEKKLLTFRDSIYVAIADKENANWKSIEKNFRTAVNRAWTINPGLVVEIIGYRIEWAPSVSEFITGLVEYGKYHFKAEKNG